MDGSYKWEYTGKTDTTDSEINPQQLYDKKQLCEQV